MRCVAVGSQQDCEQDRIPGVQKCPYPHVVVLLHNASAGKGVWSEPLDDSPQGSGGVSRAISEFEPVM
jgi:hypothetical protein